MYALQYMIPLVLYNNLFFKFEKSSLTTGASQVVAVHPDLSFA